MSNGIKVGDIDPRLIEAMHKSLDSRDSRLSNEHRVIPDHECVQGKCGATTTGCHWRCSLDIPAVVTTLHTDEELKAERERADKAEARVAELTAELQAAKTQIAQKDEALKHSCWLQMERTIHRYLGANAHGKQNGALKAHCHIDLCSTLIAVFRGETFFETELVIHPEFSAVREATRQLTDYLDERIGFPLDKEPDYDLLAPKFFEQFYKLGTEALSATSESTEAWLRELREEKVKVLREARSRIRQGGTSVFPEILSEMIAELRKNGGK